MAAALALISFVLAMCGVALGVSGVIDAVDGKLAGGAILMIIALAVFYGTYLFGRTSRKARRDALSDGAARLRQARELRFFAGYIVVGIAGVAVLPLPGYSESDHRRHHHRGDGRCHGRTG